MIPVDIRKLLSVLNVSINEEKSKKDSNSGQEITADRKTYYLVNNAITYFLSKHARACTKWLVNRGANGVVVEKDTSLVSTNSNRKVSIYEIDSISLLQLV